MQISYVTGNKGKVELINLIYKDLGINVIQEDIETPEIQDADCKEVAKYSAKYAAELLNKPVLKNDSGLVIETLNGFPGAFAKYAEEMLGAEGFIKLMEGKKNRKCYWVEALAYCEPGSEPVVFESISHGILSEDIRGNRGYPYDKIYIPEGDTRTFAEMTVDEQLATFDTKAYMELVEYLKQK
ncbi:MAG: hypothetical protein J1F35_04175 [Erysipelotrichales bacterium]|nr:hypothetical protein [Erysipelotrichales bacterium]